MKTHQSAYNERVKKRYKIQEEEKFKDLVFRKFNNSCAVENCKNKDLTIHHKKEKSEFPELEFDLDNIILLCRKHHDLVHNPHLFNKFRRLKRFKK